MKKSYFIIQPESKTLYILDYLKAEKKLLMQCISNIKLFFISRYRISSFYS